MEEKELTSEQKEFISSLAVDPKFSKNVSKLREVKNAMLEGMSIDDVKKEYLSVEKENPNQDPRAEPETMVMEQMETVDLGFGGDYIEAVVEIPRDTKTDSESEREVITPISINENKEKQQDDTSELLHMAKEAVQQLNEVKLKYEIMDDFIHKHILEQKDREIFSLQEENRNLKEELSRLRDTIRAAPMKSNSVDSKTEAVLPKNKEKKLGLSRFWKRECSENYIIRLFSNPKFTAEQIAEIRMGLEADLSESQIKSYAKQEISARQMKEIRMLYELQNKKQREE